MKESVGYTVTLNIAITFIIIVFTFIASILIYYKTNKFGNILVNSIEKYEGYNSYAIDEIDVKMQSLGYNNSPLTCKNDITYNGKTCPNVDMASSSSKGYCVYQCDDEDYYFYRIGTHMVINIPLINELVKLPIYYNTNRMYKFG